MAAAVHYLHDGGWVRGAHDPAGHVAVYDLGGGTFDTAVLSADRGGIRVVGRPGGDPDIGGEAFDQLGTRWIAAAADLLTEARIAKESLSQHETASRYVAGADADVHLSQTEFGELIGDDVRRTVTLFTETVELAGGELRGVFLAGGASRTPLVEQALRAEYDGLVRTWQDPKAVVALGAARWAAHGSAAPRRPAVPATRRPQPFARSPRPSSTRGSPRARSICGRSRTGALNSVQVRIHRARSALRETLQR